MTIFETPRLIVRTLFDSDFPHIFRMQSDPGAMRFIRAPTTDEQVVRERIAMWEAYREKCRKPFADRFVLAAQALSLRHRE